MKAKPTIPKKPKPRISVRWRAGGTEPLPDPPVVKQDSPADGPIITKSEIVALANALSTYRLARADFEMKRAALTLKLLHGCHCEESDLYVSLDEQGNFNLEDHSSLEVGTFRPLVDHDIVPSACVA